MHSGRNWTFLGVAAAGVFCICMLPARGVPVRAADSTQSCCYTNTRFQGMCTVNPVKGENCQTILAYLNNPLSTGRSYCNGTTLRRGWIRVDCETGKPITDEKGNSVSEPKSGQPLREQPNETK
jgi:hypothetical protein